MDKLVRVIFSIAAFALIAAGVPKEAKAELWNLQFAKKTSKPVPYTGAAITGDPGDYWNMDNGAVNLTLVDSQKKNAISLNITQPGANLTSLTVNKLSQNAFTGDYNNLMGGYLSTNVLQTMTFSGLAANKEYGMFVYSQGSSLKNAATNGQELKITASGITATTNPMAGGTSSFVEGLNYLQLNVFSDANGVLKVDFSPGLDVKNSSAMINAIQLSSTAHAPEPASMVLLSVGGLLAAGKLRRKSCIKEKCM